MAEIQGSKAVEDAAIARVMEIERRAGREPRDNRYDAQSPADLVSPPRVIEVKAFGTTTRGYDLWLETKQVEEARRNLNFFLYVVENVRQGDPARFTLKVLGGPRLAHLLQRAKEQRYYTVPWPVANYDATPGNVDPEKPKTAPGHPPAREPGQPQRSAPRETAPVPQVGAGDYQTFENNDLGYLAWLGANPAGFVINIQRTYNARDARLHRAGCHTISGTPAKGSTWTGPYVKVCSAKIQVLDEWARDKGVGAIRRCGACNP